MDTLLLLACVAIAWTLLIVGRLREKPSASWTHIGFVGPVVSIVLGLVINAQAAFVGTGIVGGLNLLLAIGSGILLVRQGRKSPD